MKKGKCSKVKKEGTKFDSANYWVEQQQLKRKATENT